MHGEHGAVGEGVRRLRDVADGVERHATRPVRAPLRRPRDVFFSLCPLLLFPLCPEFPASSFDRAELALLPVITLHF